MNGGARDGVRPGCPVDGKQVVTLQVCDAVEVDSKMDCSG